MHTLIHLSDLHFGSADPHIIQQLQDTVIKLNPDAIVISGDLTTRARASEFIEAAEFLGKLPNVKIVVPGNHDISLYNVIRRFFRPLQRFRSYIAKQEESHYVTEEVIVIGLNSSRSFTIKGGNISSHQIENVQKIIKESPQENIKVIVTHHPVLKMHPRIIESFVDMGVDLFLAGHMHKSGSSLAIRKLRGQDYNVLSVQAGTATSVRYRDEPNSFNLLVIDGFALTVQTFTWGLDSKSFVKVAENRFIHTDAGWKSNL